MELGKRGDLIRFLVFKKIVLPLRYLLITKGKIVA